MDRITKPALYAQAGIPYYWRVETGNGIVVHTCRIDPVHEVYVETGKPRNHIEVDEPWEMSIPISRLTPRHLRRG